MPRGARPQPISHGTYGGYQVHVKRRSVPCAACEAARKRYKAAYRLRRVRCAKGLGLPLEARRG